MRKPFAIPCLLLFLPLAGICASAGGPPGPIGKSGDEIAGTLLAAKLAAPDSGGPLIVGGDTLDRNGELAAFYQARGNRPAWLSGGDPLPGAWQLLDAVRNAGKEGLVPAAYHARRLDSLLRLYNLRVYWQRRRDPETSANLDLLLTDAFLKLSRHLLVGRVQPEIRRDGWHVSPESVDRAEYLEGTLAGRHDVRERLHALTPTAPEYGKMKYWLEVYRGLAADGGWGTVPDGPALGPGSKGSRVAALCARLRAGGEWRGSACGEAFTPALGRAVERFQAAHGLDTDGAVGTRTLAALNVSVEDRIRQIELNLDCWRWLPRDLGRRHVRVNIADYRLGAFERDRQAFSMRVVVGRKEDSTPVFSDRIVSVELNPAWNVPPSIAAEEMLPELRKDPRYLADHDMELLTGWSDTARTLRADSIDWEAISQEDFPFMIRQRNGDASALGRLKFVLTNPFNIYLHDTPAKRYFEKDKRALSHGCVRVADPLKLAQWVLGPDTAWTRKRLSEAIGKGDERYLPVPGKGVPVHLLYWTCFVDKEGGLQFRPDVYHWNGRMKAAMAGDAGHP